MKPPLHSNTFSAEMRKISRLIKYFPVSQNLKLRWKYYFGARQYQRKMKVQQAKGASESALDTIRNHWRYEQALIYKERRGLITKKYIRKAHSLFVPVPQFTFGIDDNECWETGTNGYSPYLTDKGLAIVREEIEKEEKRRREARKHWLQWVAALTGLIGTIIGLFAVLNK